MVPNLNNVWFCAFRKAEYDGGNASFGVDVPGL